MADVGIKFTDLPVASALTGAEVLAIVQGGISKQATVEDIISAALVEVLPINLATQVTGNLAISHLNSGIGASASTAWFGDGTWKPISSTPGGSSGMVQYNNAGAFGGVAGFEFLDGGSSQVLYLGGSGAGFLTPKASTGTDAGKLLQILGGMTTNADGGALNLLGGSASSQGHGGAANLSGGAGVGTDKNGGDVNLTGGAATGAGTPGVINLITGGLIRVTVGKDGEIKIGGNPGGAGQALVSSGLGAPPQWVSSVGGGPTVAQARYGGTGGNPDSNFANFGCGVCVREDVGVFLVPFLSGTFTLPPIVVAIADDGGTQSITAKISPTTQSTDNARIVFTDSSDAPIDPQNFDIIAVQSSGGGTPETNGLLSDTIGAGTTNNYNPTGFDSTIGFLDIDPSSGDATITGIQAGQDGQLLSVTNTNASNSLTLNSMDGGSSSNNRIRLPTNITLTQFMTLLLRYSGSLGLWVAVL